MHPIDQNLWGVTFASDSDTFYATMRTGSHDYLIRGHVHTKRAEVLRDGVECPSISPDGTRLAFKSRIDNGFNPATWRLHVLDLATLDDQAAWLDDSTVVYQVAQIGEGDGVVDTWSVLADGTDAPKLLVPAGESQ